MQTPRKLAPLYKAHQPPRVDTNVPRTKKSINLTQSLRAEQIIMPTESPRVNHLSPPIFDPYPLAVPSVKPISDRTRSRRAKEIATQLRAKNNIAPPAIGPAFNTRSAIRSTSTSQLEQELAIAFSLKPATHQAKKDPNESSLVPCLQQLWQPCRQKQNLIQG